MVGDEILAFTQRFGVGITLFDLDGHFKGHLKGNQAQHDHPLCLKEKDGDLQKCWAFDRDRVALEMRRRGRAFWKTCHAGVSEWVLPVRHLDQVTAIISLGPFLLRRGQAALVAEGSGAVREEVEALDGAGQRSVEALGHILVSHLQAWLDRRPMAEGIGREKRIEEFFLRDHARPDISLGDLARHLHLGTSRVTQVLRESFGKGFPEMVAEARLDKAKRLLRGTNLPVGVVAREVGYADPNYFMRQFKKMEGATPSQYRGSRQRELV